MIVESELSIPSSTSAGAACRAAFSKDFMAERATIFVIRSPSASPAPCKRLIKVLADWSTVQELVVDSSPSDVITIAGGLGVWKRWASENIRNRILPSTLVPSIDGHGKPGSKSLLRVNSGDRWSRQQLLLAELAKEMQKLWPRYALRFAHGFQFSKSPLHIEVDCPPFAPPVSASSIREHASIMVRTAPALKKLTAEALRKANLNASARCLLDGTITQRDGVVIINSLITFPDHIRSVRCCVEQDVSCNRTIISSSELSKGCS